MGRDLLYLRPLFGSSASALKKSHHGVVSAFEPQQLRSARFVTHSIDAVIEQRVDHLR